MSDGSKRWCLYTPEIKQPNIILTKNSVLNIKKGSILDPKILSEEVCPNK
jgi:hypothetical protein